MDSTISDIETDPNVIQDSPLERFGLQIRLCRRKAGYKPVEFAFKTGVNIETLAAIEFGFAPLEIVSRNLSPIACGLGIPERALKRFLSQLFYNKE